MLTHLFSDLFDVLVFENNSINKQKLVNYEEISTDLLLNTELLNFYLALKKNHQLSLNVFTSAYYLANKQAKISQKHFKKFDQLYSTVLLGFSKHNQQAYELLAQNTKAKPQNCLFIDDKQLYTQTAQKAGFMAITHHNNHQTINNIKSLL
ncbi:MAG: HAD-IA family hydrolase [Candidatus Pacebacteria bacterium]|nr:HAD-IA family hydrolase [Candidatus Paceibacterota bacterium]